MIYMRVIENFNAEAPNKFTIYMQGHNVSLLAIAFDGPAKPECMLTTQKDGSVDAAYKTPVPGEYKVHIKFNDKHIDGSPFKVKILGDKKAAVEKIKVSGEAVTTGKTCLTNEIIVDAVEAGITSKSLFLFNSYVSLDRVNSASCSLLRWR